MPRQEFGSSLKCHPIASFKAWHLELFDKVARQTDLIPDPSDTLVEWRGSAARPRNQRLADNMWDIISSIEDKTSCPELFPRVDEEVKLTLTKARGQQLMILHHLPRNSPSACPLCAEHLSQKLSSPPTSCKVAYNYNSEASSFMAWKSTCLGRK